jgi:putative transposase
MIEQHLIWDGPPSHRSKVMKEWIATQRRWLVVERLPAYSHDLNPIELVWANRKTSELANLCPDTIEEAASYADPVLNRIGRDSDMCSAFPRHCGPSLRQKCQSIARGSLEGVLLIVHTLAPS